MKRRVLLRLLSILALAAAPAYAGDAGGKNGSSAGKNMLNGISFDGSRQGQTVGWADIDGDGVNDKIVGAPYASSPSNTGSVVVYKGDMTGGFAASPYLLLDGDDNYGYSFVNLGDVDGDGNDDFAVGAINGDGADVSLAGSVTVYRGGRNWNVDEGVGKIIAKLSGEGPMDKFGVFVAAADLNGDGKKDLIAGAPYNTSDPALYQGGAAYVFLAPDFTDKVVLHASKQAKGLGWSAAAGDVNGDGVPDLCISASGQAFCYYGGTAFHPSIDAPDVVIKSAAAGFAKALAVVGDVDGDGFGDLAIGAPNAVVGGRRDTGSIFVIRGGTGRRTVNADTASADRIARIDGAASFDRFGASVAAVGDVDGDGMADFAAGAPLAGTDAFRLAGKVYFFRGMDVSASATLADAAVFQADAENQGYGSSLASAGYERLLIGTPGAHVNAGGTATANLLTGESGTNGGEGGGTGGDGGCP